VLIAIIGVSLMLGAVAGVLAGLFGIGGGLVVVPVLAMVFKAWSFPDAALLLMAVATSLASIAVTSIASVSAHQRLGAVVWVKVWRLAPGILLGAGLGSVVAKSIPAETLRLILAGFLLCVGLQMALQKTRRSGGGGQNPWHDYVVSTLIGLLSAMVGIGGGTLTVPYLLRGGMVIQKAVAVSSACGLPIAVAGMASYAWLGWFAHGLPDWSFGYVFWPAALGIGLTGAITAPIGAKLAHRLPAQRLKRYFSLLLFLMAIKLLGH